MNQAEKAKTLEVKKKTEYHLLDINLGKNKNFIKDQ